MKQLLAPHSPTDVPLPDSSESDEMKKQELPMQPLDFYQQSPEVTNECFHKNQALPVHISDMTT